MSILKDNLQEIKTQKDTYLLPENIKKGITVLGITGTYEYSNVRLFETVDEMNNCDNPIVGNLAVVYGKCYVAASESSTFDNQRGFYLPKQIELTQEIANSDQYYLTCDNVNILMTKTDSTFVLTIQKEVNDENPDIYTYNIENNVATRQDDSDEVIYINSGRGRMWSTVWTDALHQFMCVQKPALFGVYQYSTNGWNLVEAANLTNSPFKIFKNSPAIGSGINYGLLGRTDEITTTSDLGKICEAYSDIHKSLNLSSELTSLNLGSNSTSYSFEYLPKLDTSNVTYFNFYNCKNLKEIPDWDFSNATYLGFSNCLDLQVATFNDSIKQFSGRLVMQNCSSLREINNLQLDNTNTLWAMFVNCISLTSLPITTNNNVDRADSVYQGCTGLTEIPDVEFQKAYTIYGLFNYCSNLVTAGNINVPKATAIAYLFAHCTSLENVPVYNFPLATNFSSIFSGCESLTDTSLNNILQTCINMTAASSNKTLKYIGLTEEQATKCTTLDNYTAFTNAGWTTGY